MKKQACCMLMLGSIVSTSFKTIAQNHPLTYYKVAITWVDTLTGDFSFNTQWEYPAGISRNAHGQLVQWYSPGMEPEGLFEPDGRIKKDSITAYYKRVDTSRLYRNVRWESNCYPKRSEAEDVMEVLASPGNVHCTNSLTAKSNCKFKINISPDTCWFLSAVVDIMDVVIYDGVSGTMEVDKNAWKRGVLKAQFSFLFRNPYDPDDTHYWKGLMYVNLPKVDAEKIPALIPGGK